MFKLFLICTIVGLAVASPLSQGHRSRPSSYHAPARSSAHASTSELGDDVISRKDDVRADGFDTSLETSNHITRSESGDEHGNIHGNFGWISPEGEHIEMSYVADENGYQPQGSHLPTPPPIPDYILKAIAYINSHPPAPEYHH